MAVTKRSHDQEGSIEVRAMPVEAERIFPRLPEDVHANLVKGEAVSEDTPLPHVLRHSKSTFEQILDAKGFLYQPDRGGLCHFETIRFTA